MTDITRLAQMAIDGQDGGDFYVFTQGALERFAALLTEEKDAQIAKLKSDIEILTFDVYKASRYKKEAI